MRRSHLTNKKMYDNCLKWIAHPYDKEWTIYGQNIEPFPTDRWWTCYIYHPDDRKFYLHFFENLNEHVSPPLPKWRKVLILTKAHIFTLIRYGTIVDFKSLEFVFRQYAKHFYVTILQTNEHA